ncbi:hypothetical protein [Photorhabdus luminescens]|nr:hypothetical protein [Photorhabdus luminescens]
MSLNHDKDGDIVPYARHDAFSFRVMVSGNRARMSSHDERAGKKFNH